MHNIQDIYDLFDVPKEEIYFYLSQKRLFSVLDLLPFLEYREELPFPGATDGKKIFLGPSFSMYSLEEKCFVICHEVLHIIYGHLNLFHLKFGGYRVFTNQILFNICIDAIVNEKLKVLLGFIPDNFISIEYISSLIPPGKKIPKNITTKSLYNILTDSRVFNTLCSNCNLDSLMEKYRIQDKTTIKDSRFSEVEKSKEVEEVQEGLNIPISKQLEKELHIGKNGIKAENAIEDALRTLEDKDNVDITELIYAEDLLTEYKKDTIAGSHVGKLIQVKETQTINASEIISFVKDFIGTEIRIKGHQRTYRRPNRRLPDSPLKGSLPFKHLKSLIIYLDTSGSMNEPFVKQMYTTLKKEHIHIPFTTYTFDNLLHKVNFNEKDTIMIGGGTNIKNVVEHFNKGEHEIGIMITDCEDTFSLSSIKSPLLLFTNDTKFSTSNKEVQIKYFKW